MCLKAPHAAAGGCTGAESARAAAQPGELTGRPHAELLDDRLAEVEMEALRNAVHLGIEQADRGEFTTRSVAVIFAEGIAAAKALPRS